MSALLETLPAQPRVLLDSNTVLALWLFRDPKLPHLRAACEAGRFVLLAREETLEELRRVLAYTQFAVAPDAQAALLAEYRARVELVPAIEPEYLLPKCRDSDDQKFIELAFTGGANLLLSRDKAVLRLAKHRLLRERVAIITPEAFERWLSVAMG
ncbi:MULTISPECIES: putative toxin-antitoxin system toxin component, PIN family [Niveibacterium]|uniref:Toxin-antitoxin system toxin component, PIN family n=1 Tax=Niveibacterium microcysteis TaxID=2811415 RepID=A0ABX7M752_9RHOO|nr:MULTISPECIES: putative toxin-antitoxin system toxin component, PIN family [Niveibacterium]QSI77577.1 putative toxin-antitoxin system toxin component, PIN family [Niveibacterium microcysteis]